MTYCYLVDQRGAIEKLTTADVKNIAFQITGQRPRSLADAKRALCIRYHISEGVCFCYAEARNLADYYKGLKARERKYYAV